MAYAALADVQVLRPHQTLDASSTPTATQVTDLLTKISAMIDGRIAPHGFVVPVTAGTVALAYLKTMATFWVAGIVEDQQRAAIAGGEESATRSHYIDIAEKMLDAVDENPRVLVDATQSTAESLKGARGPVIDSYFIQNPEDDEDAGFAGSLEDTAKPRFSIRMDL